MPSRVGSRTFCGKNIILDKKITQDKPTAEDRDSNCQSDRLKDTLDKVTTKIPQPVSIVRLDDGYLSAELLDYIASKHLSVIMGARYDWVMAQKPKIDLEYTGKTSCVLRTLMKCFGKWINLLILYSI